MKNCFIPFLFFLLIKTDNCAAQAGTLDPTFGGSGYVITPMGAGAWGVKLLMQPDGKIVATGIDYQNIPNQTGNSSGTTIFSVARYNTDGSLDRTFGIGGKAQYVNGLSPWFAYIHPPAVLQGDGRILQSETVLNADGNYDFVLFRLNPDGSVDSAFGSDGRVQTDDSSRNDMPVDIAVQPDGKIIEAGISTDSSTTDFLIARFLPNGTLDSSFGINGKMIKRGGITHMSLLASGQIILLTETGSLLRLNADGSIDGSFAPTAQYYLPPNLDIITMEEAGDSSIYLGGYLNFVTRLFPTIVKTGLSGNLDSSFNGTGYVIDSSLWPISYTSALAIQPDGKVLALDFAYSSDHSPTPSTVAVRRYKTNGQVDSSFGADGIFLLDTNIVRAIDGESIMLDADGKILVLGTVVPADEQSSFLTLRLLNDLNLGLLDLDEQENISQIYPDPVHGRATITYQLAKDETISMSLYDMEGRMVQALCQDEYKTQGSQRQTIDINENIPAGDYIVRIGREDGCNSSIRIVVK